MLHWFAKRMTEASREARKDERGFTLIELLVVVIIIGILAAIAIPAYLSQRDRAEEEAARANVRNAATAQQAWYTENGCYTADITDLESVGFRQGEPAVNVASGSGNNFCVDASGGGQDVLMDQDSGAPEEGSCP